MFIYCIVNSETLKIYIGQHKGSNLQKYLQTKFSDARKGRSGSSHLFNAMRKYSKSVWSIHPLIPNLQTREECDYWEKVLINALNSQHHRVGYNIKAGGAGNVNGGEIFRKTMSDAMTAYYAAGGIAGMTGKKQTEKWRAGVAERVVRMTATIREKVAAGELTNGMTGKKHSEISKQKNSDAHKGKQAGDKNPFFGHKHSEESKKKNSKAHQKPWSPKRRATYDAGHPPKIKPAPEETKQRQSDAAKRRWASSIARQEQSARLKGIPKPRPQSPVRT